MIAVVGGVPGGKGGRVQISDTPWYKFLVPPPFPTWLKPLPRTEELRGSNTKNPWFIDGVKDPASILHTKAAVLKSVQSRHLTDLFWAKLLKDESIQQFRYQNPVDYDPKLAAQGKILVDKLRKETLEAQKAARKSLEAETAPTGATSEAASAQTTPDAKKKEPNAKKQAAATKKQPNASKAQPNAAKKQTANAKQKQGASKTKPNASKKPVLASKKRDNAKKEPATSKNQKKEDQKPITKKSS
jgi:hypothetical protein